ncbi:hypothetical protein M427DRAFT_392368 [Gonapodya prolifera JEL478]|uniref:Uncharacterized protein n=1 Tax=Gonapodya prolifera (strain JEL478) TaxID=1344416 RepID=A0A139A6Y4_GONPJ|nr:hypothetical protein M427DRAFT_392368 [Gonapodya prolifera JEL478]|eukprot:KXS12582.1 hypothetical protein M427DRAFT_392368 [Gonapodya prolifera JEL478]
MQRELRERWRRRSPDPRWRLWGRRSSMQSWRTSRPRLVSRFIRRFVVTINSPPLYFTQDLPSAQRIFEMARALSGRPDPVLHAMMVAAHSSIAGDVAGSEEVFERYPGKKDARMYEALITAYGEWEDSRVVFGQSLNICF